VLRRHNATATFFCIGQCVEKHPELAARVAAEGHLIGNHSYHHGQWASFFSASQLIDEYERAQTTIARAVGYRPAFVRTPLGLTSPPIAAMIRHTRLVLVGWNVRGLDRRAAAEVVVARVLRKVRDGSIIVLHDGDVEPGNLVALAEGLIGSLRERCFELVRVDTLLDEIGSSQ
jgi:peptidoglycan/xylan/chitin deacetylase (PgdA/CDA1 family)